MKCTHPVCGLACPLVCLLVGWIVGELIRIQGSTLALWFAFLAGGMLIITIKEELPTADQGRFWPLLLAVGGYAAIILAIETAIS